jgi:hypothetical protein
MKYGMRWPRKYSITVNTSDDETATDYYWTRKGAIEAGAKFINLLKSRGYDIGPVESNALSFQKSEGAE